MSALLLAALLGCTPASGAVDEGVAAAPACPTSPAQMVAAAPPAADAYDTDLDLDPAEPDFGVITLPTNLRLPRHKLALRLTHRFARPLGEGRFPDLAGDFFGLDGGAQVGVGLAFGLFRGSRLALYRTSDRTIELQAQQELLHEGDAVVGVSLVGSLEGLDNFGLSDPGSPVRHEFSPAAGLLLSRKLGDRAALYVEPAWVGHTRTNPSAPGARDGTLLAGLGARLRVTRTMSLLAEVHPRLFGYRGDLGSGDPAALATFAAEWRVGGHSFQLNFSNGLATTPGQIARGASSPSGWFVGFNLTRKFY